jgi:micrococcal nuclease
MRRVEGRPQLKTTLALAALLIAVWAFRTEPAIIDRLAGFDGAKLASCTAVDGDTIRCGSERIRLLGIDAPEKPGTCRAGRECAPGDYEASTASLTSALSGAITIERVGKDRYGRTLGMVAGEKGDLSCWQLKAGQAVYVDRWDNGGRVKGTCPSALRR